MEDKARTLNNRKLRKMEKRIDSIYSRASHELQKKAEEYFSKFESQDKEKQKLLKEGKISKDAYRQWRKSKVMYGQRFEALKEQCAEQLLHTNETAVAYINDQMPEVYSVGYNVLVDSVDGVGGYSFALMNPNTVKVLATTDTSLLPTKKLDPAKDIPWNMKKINAETLQGIIQGESMRDIAKRILNVQKMNKHAAIRTARTLVTGAENKGRQDSYKRAEADGIILQKEWLSSNEPGRTRDWHFPESFESVIVDTDEPFVNGLGEIMYPGDPSAAPGNVYNCRCSMAAVVKGFRKV